jgi:hypothetical protein
MERFTPASPDHPVQRTEREGNIAVTYGLNNLAERLVSASAAFSDQTTKGWCQAMAVGTDSSPAPSFTGDTLNSSQTFVLLSAASMAVSDAGARTLEYQATFDDASAYLIAEVGLFGTQNASGSMIAHSTLAATDQVNKGTGDTVNISYQLIFDSKA